MKDEKVEVALSHKDILNIGLQKINTKKTVGYVWVNDAEKGKSNAIPYEAQSEKGSESKGAYGLAAIIANAKLDKNVQHVLYVDRVNEGETMLFSDDIPEKEKKKIQKQLKELPNISFKSVDELFEECEKVLENTAENGIDKYNDEVLKHNRSLGLMQDVNLADEESVRQYNAKNVQKYDRDDVLYNEGYVNYAKTYMPVINPKQMIHDLREVYMAEMKYGRPAFAGNAAKIAALIKDGMYSDIGVTFDAQDLLKLQNSPDLKSGDGAYFLRANNIKLINLAGVVETFSNIYREDLGPVVEMLKEAQKYKIDVESAKNIKWNKLFDTYPSHERVLKQLAVMKDVETGKNIMQDYKLIEAKEKITPEEYVKQAQEIRKLYDGIIKGSAERKGKFEMISRYQDKAFGLGLQHALRDQYPKEPAHTLEHKYSHMGIKKDVQAAKENVHEQNLSSKYEIFKRTGELQADYKSDKKNTAVNNAPGKNLKQVGQVKKGIIRRFFSKIANTFRSLFRRERVSLDLNSMQQVNKAMNSTEYQQQKDNVIKEFNKSNVQEQISK